MENAYIQHLVGVAVDDVASDLFHVIPVLSEAFLLRDGVAVHKRHRKDALCRQLVNHVRAVDLCLILDAVFLEELRILRLHAEVQLLLRHLLEFFDDFYQVHLVIGIVRAFPDLAEALRKLLQHDEILAHHVRDVRTLHLCHNLPAVLEYGIMSLPDGGGSQGLVPELLVDLVDLFPGLLLDHFPCQLRVELLHILAQLFKLLAVALRKQVQTAGHDLPDLDISRSQILQRGAQFFRCETVRVEIMFCENPDDLRTAAL